MKGRIDTDRVSDMVSEVYGAIREVTGKEYVGGVKVDVYGDGGVIVELTGAGGYNVMESFVLEPGYGDFGCAVREMLMHSGIELVRRYSLKKL